MSGGDSICGGIGASPDGGAGSRSGAVAGGSAQGSPWPVVGWGRGAAGCCSSPHGSFQRCAGAAPAVPDVMPALPGAAPSVVSGAAGPGVVPSPLGQESDVAAGRSGPAGGSAEGSESTVRGAGCACESARCELVWGSMIGAIMGPRRVARAGGGVLLASAPGSGLAGVCFGVAPCGTIVDSASSRGGLFFGFATSRVASVRAEAAG